MNTERLLKQSNEAVIDMNEEVARELAHEAIGEVDPLVASRLLSNLAEIRFTNEALAVMEQAYQEKTKESFEKAALACLAVCYANVEVFRDVERFRRFQKEVKEEIAARGIDSVVEDYAELSASNQSNDFLRASGWYATHLALLEDAENAK